MRASPWLLRISTEAARTAAWSYRCIHPKRRTAMNVGQICQRNVVTVRASDDLSTAARMMREKHIGYLIVVEPTSQGERTPVGVLTDRDIVVAVVAQDADPRALTVGDVMTCNPKM